MEKLHRSLVKRSRSYRSWHKHDAHAAMHWAVFVFVALFVSNYVLGAIASTDRQEIQGAAVQSVSAKVKMTKLPKMEAAQDHILVKYKANVGQTKKAEMLAKHGLTEKDEIKQIGVKIVSISPNDTPEEVVARLKAQEPQSIEFAEVDQVIAPDFVINDPLYGNAWHLPKIAAPTAWDKTTGNSVVYAILDSGVECTHSDLAGACLPGYNFYDNNTNTSDVYGHGTWVAGTAMAVLNNSVGSAGVCGNCKIMPIRISDTAGYAMWSTMAKGLTYAADNGAKVANMSYAVQNASTIDSAANYFRNKGGIVVNSAGNNGTLATGADDPYTLTIASTDSDDSPSVWSNYGPVVDLSAPGNYIFTTDVGNTYTQVAGTSFASPIVGAVGALVFSVNPTLSPATVDDILKKSADDLGPAGKDDKYGWGRINAGKAVALACTYTGANCPGITSTVTPSPVPVVTTSPSPSPTTTPVATDVTAPTVPTGLTGSSPDASTVNLSWGPSSDPVVSGAPTSGIASYRVYRDGVLVKTIAALAYTDTTMASGATHSYQVTAVDAAGNESAKTNSLILNVPAPVVSVQITSYRVATKTGTAATITWTTNVATSGSISYGTNSANLSQTIADGTLSTSHTITLTNLSRNTKYYYTITASNGSSQSKVSSNFRTGSK